MTAPLTPVELRDGRLYKREDLHRLPAGVNGAKLRACQLLIGRAAAAGAAEVVSASSVLSPQSAMAAAVAADHGLNTTVILGGSREDSALRHTAVATAVREGARLRFVPVGYNPMLQKAAREYAAGRPDVYHLHYGITPPPDAPSELIRAFHATSADQVANLPDGIRTLVLPFGSGNTGTGVLWGLLRRPPVGLQRVVLAVIGPDRLPWARERLAMLGVDLDRAPFRVRIEVLHKRFASYGDRMPETRDGITFHPTYEGKVIRYLDQLAPPWWTARDGRTLMWIVGGPLPKIAGAAS